MLQITGENQEAIKRDLYTSCYNQVMDFLDKPITLSDLITLKKRYGEYIKLTVDLENGRVVVGTELHADGEKILLEKDGRQDDIWGGGINLKDKTIDTTAVLNLRPRLGNDSMEILDPDKREKFVSIIKKFFARVWD